MHTSLVIVWLLATLTAVGESFLIYADRIPNGRFVQHPCKPNILWKGVGHFNVNGGGHRNPFGLDFKTAGLRWTDELCRKDSDGDGRTNGEELGDPDCVWVPDALPARTKGISHPGVCDQYDSLVCERKTFNHVVYRTQQEWMADACKENDFVCDELNSPDVKNQTLRFPPTPVPAKETTYMCYMFNFQEPTEEVHMIATEPILDNLEVMHHMLLFGCKDGTEDPGNGQAFECGMAPHYNCMTIIGMWTLGQNGECLPNTTGRSLGLKGYKTLALQIHWNNPEEITTYNDSSGMTLFYTRNLRPFNTAVLVLGSDLFVIPPRRKHVEVTSICSSSCTKELNGSVYITSAFNHMHYLGVSMSIEHLRDGKALRNITVDEIYSYNSPKLHKFDNPVEVRPGDELRTRCHYNSMSRATSTVFGDSTQQEMCYGFVSFYPEHAAKSKFCTTSGSISLCDPTTLGGCDPQAYMQRFYQYLHDDIIGNCSVYGPCYEECKATLREAMRNEPCMRNNDFRYMAIDNWFNNNPYFMNFLGALASCAAKMAREDVLASLPPSTTGPSSRATAAVSGGVTVAWFMSLLIMESTLIALNMVRGPSWLLRL